MTPLDALDQYVGEVVDGKGPGETPERRCRTQRARPTETEGMATRAVSLGEGMAAWRRRLTGRHGGTARCQE